MIAVRCGVCFSMNNACKADKSIGIIFCALCRPAHTIMIILMQRSPHGASKCWSHPSEGVDNALGRRASSWHPLGRWNKKSKQNNLCRQFFKVFRRLVLNTSARGATGDGLLVGHRVRVHKLSDGICYWQSWTAVYFHRRLLVSAPVTWLAASEQVPRLIVQPVTNGRSNILVSLDLL